MIVGGEKAENDVEVVDLLSNERCNFKPADIPLQRGSSGIFMEGQAIVCESAGDMQYPMSKKCYSYNNVTNEWLEVFETNLHRYFAADLLLSDTEWWLLGGNNPHKKACNSITLNFMTGAGEVNNYHVTNTTEICSLSAGCRIHDIVLPQRPAYPSAVSKTEN